MRKRMLILVAGLALTGTARAQNQGEAAPPPPPTSERIAQGGGSLTLTPVPAPAAAPAPSVTNLSAESIRLLALELKNAGAVSPTGQQAAATVAPAADPQTVTAIYRPAGPIRRFIGAVGNAIATVGHDRILVPRSAPATATVHVQLAPVTVQATAPAPAQAAAVVMPSAQASTAGGPFRRLLMRW